MKDHARLGQRGLTSRLHLDLAGGVPWTVDSGAPAPALVAGTSDTN